MQLPEHPLVVVSGLPRSGTSLMMALLAAGGHPILTDDERPPDADNPRGYFEYEPVKALQRDNGWLREKRGQAVKIISPLLPSIPADIPLKVILMQRSLAEILASQNSMLARRGQAPSASQKTLVAACQKHLAAIREFLTRRPSTQVLFADFQSIIRDPRQATARLREFLPNLVNAEAMIGVIDPRLHRQRDNPAEFVSEP